MAAKAVPSGSAIRLDRQTERVIPGTLGTGRAREAVTSRAVAGDVQALLQEVGSGGHGATCRTASSDVAQLKLRVLPQPSQFQEVDDAPKNKCAASLRRRRWQSRHATLWYPRLSFVM